jgi:hypothetical protein
MAGERQGMLGPMRPMTRREAAKLLGMGAASAALARLSGCGTILDWRLTMLAEKLLRDKYGRDFVIYDKHYGWETYRRPSATCHAEGEEDLLFTCKIDVAAREIVEDTYVGRKLGRQVEGIIGECFDRQGIESAAHCIVLTSETDPDMAWSEYVVTYGHTDVLARLFITDAVPTPRTSTKLIEAAHEIYEITQIHGWMRVYIIRSEDYEAYNEFLTIATSFSSPRPIGLYPVDGFLINVNQSVFETGEGDFWKY